MLLHGVSSTVHAAPTFARCRHLAPAAPLRRVHHYRGLTQASAAAHGSDGGGAARELLAAARQVSRALRLLAPRSPSSDASRDSP